MWTLSSVFCSGIRKRKEKELPLLTPSKKKRSYFGNHNLMHVYATVFPQGIQFNTLETIIEIKTCMTGIQLSSHPIVGSTFIKKNINIY
jgi:hypothetical protein